MTIAAPRRRPHGNEYRVGSGHRRLKIAREAQPSGCHVAGNKVVEPGLVDRHLAARQALDLRGILIDAGDLDAELREARPGNQPDIPGPDHRYAHERGLLFRMITNAQMSLKLPDHLNEVIVNVEYSTTAANLLFRHCGRDELTTLVPHKGSVQPLVARMAD